MGIVDESSSGSEIESCCISLGGRDGNEWGELGAFNEVSSGGVGWMERTLLSEERRSWFELEISTAGSGWGDACE